MVFENEHSELLAIAEDDLESAIILANYYKPKIEIACYHCHQCAEKTLKAFISFSNLKFKFIHNLNELCKDCQKIDISFSTIYPECKALNKYFSETRYIKHLQFTEYDMKQAIKQAEKILRFVKDKTQGVS